MRGEEVVSGGRAGAIGEDQARSEDGRDNARGGKLDADAMGRVDDSAGGLRELVREDASSYSAIYSTRTLYIRLFALLRPARPPAPCPFLRSLYMLPSLSPL